MVLQQNGLFMVQSVSSNYKDMLCLILISKLDTRILQAWLQKVLVALPNLFVIVAVSADNHICNR